MAHSQGVRLRWLRVCSTATPQRSVAVPNFDALCLPQVIYGGADQPIDGRAVIVQSA